MILILVTNHIDEKIYLITMNNFNNFKNFKDLFILMVSGQTIEYDCFPTVSLDSFFLIHTCNMVIFIDIYAVNSEF